MSFEHISVLLEEMIEAMNLAPESIAIDATFGGGGHSRAILRKLSSGRLMAFDRDPVAIAHGRAAFGDEIAEGRLDLVHEDFSQVGEITAQRGLAGQVAAVCADLGVSSPQLDDETRGFSVHGEGPLDMRMDQSKSDLDAAQVVNTYSEESLARIFFDFGEEPKGRHYARKIVSQRAVKPFETTRELADFVSRVNPYREKSRRHPAVKLFQAIRIEVNHELEQIDAFLASAWKVLAPGGRLAVITFHSLEDRAVKRFFTERSKVPGKDAVTARLPIRNEDLPRAEGRCLRPFPRLPTETEIESNPRARSAKLRVLEKTTTIDKEA